MPVKPAVTNESQHPTSHRADLKEVRSEKPGARADEHVSPNARKSDAIRKWNSTSGMKIFHFGDGPPSPVSATGFMPMPPDRVLPGFLSQAARDLLNVTQSWLREQAQVSKKTINDFENGYAAPKTALNLRIRRALEQAGAQFVHGEDLVGVVVYTSRSDGRR